MKSDNKSLNKNKSLRRVLLETAAFFTLVFMVYILLWIFFQEELQKLSLWSIEHLGLAGVAVFVYAVDTFIVPATADLVFPLTTTWPPVPLLLTMSAASILGGMSGFFLARALSHISWIQDAVSYYREHGERLIRRYGLWAIVLAGLTPLPYSTISWIGGMLKLPAAGYLLASLSRIPRFFLYYAIIESGRLLIS
ncbi:YqaA family protein [Salinispira pacifica]|uniref:VTT domain-containing protein n=1 Tax=Salinispira pacifica TaxID=1307761 RepID=V5WLI9_9SPIO|nr:VTT domain-containing protein [Salinispira pacifica]AHC16802.1 hypothetical protein L21SP2_3466 [Salinispira pacifica]